MRVAYRQRLAATAIVRRPPALKVDGPDSSLQAARKRVVIQVPNDAPLGPRRLIDERIEATLVELLEPLVAGLPADAELAAQLPEQHLLRQRLQNKISLMIAAAE